MPRRPSASPGCTAWARPLVTRRPSPPRQPRSSCRPAAATPTCSARRHPAARGPLAQALSLLTLAVLRAFGWLALIARSDHQDSRPGASCKQCRVVKPCCLEVNNAVAISGLRSGAVGGGAGRSGRTRQGVPAAAGFAEEAEAGPLPPRQIRPRPAVHVISRER